MNSRRSQNPKCYSRKCVKCQGKYTILFEWSNPDFIHCIQL